MNTLTLKRFQFLGRIDREYFIQMIPVAARADDWERLRWSAGLAKSPTLAMTNPWAKNGEIFKNPKNLEISGTSGYIFNTPWYTKCNSEKTTKIDSYI